jgi:peptidoglycan-associated lipoprotein
MVDLGVPASRFATVSFGEYRPALEGHDEAAWRLNRRGVLALEERHVSHP